MAWVNMSLTGVRVTGSTSPKNGDRLIILFGGGTKRGQQRDIDKAKELLAEYKARKKAMASKATSKHKE
jgi:hypothetical protein